MAPGHGAWVDSDDEEEMSMGYYDAVRHLTSELWAAYPDTREYKIVAPVDLVCTEENSPDGEDHTIRFLFTTSGHQFEDGGSVEQLFLVPPGDDGPAVEVTSGAVYRLLCDVVVPTIPMLGRSSGYATWLRGPDGKTTATTGIMYHLINHETYTKLAAASH